MRIYLLNIMNKGGQEFLHFFKEMKTDVFGIILEADLIVFDRVNRMAFFSGCINNFIQTVRIKWECRLKDNSEYGK